MIDFAQLPTGAIEIGSAAEVPTWVEATKGGE